MSELDFNYIVDSMIALNRITYMEEYYSRDQEEKLKKMKLVRKSKFDTAGRIVNCVVGSDINLGKVDIVMSYNLVNDTTIRQVAKISYDKVKSLPVFFSDENIKETKLEKLVFGHNQDSFVTVQSKFYGAQGSTPVRIERFNKDNRLFQIWYPLGLEEPKIVNSDTFRNERSNRVATTIFEWRQSKTKVIKEFNSRGELVMEINASKRTSDSTYSYSTEYYFYDQVGRIIRINRSDGDNQLKSTYEYHYKGEVLARFDRFDEPDSTPAVTKIYDEITGKLNTSEDRTGKNIIQLRYKYNSLGLVEQIDEFKNHKRVSMRLFKYR